MEFSRNEAKSWARSHYTGLQGIVMPSFTPDLARLDEEAIRWDVDHCHRHGMFSVLVEFEATSLSLAERNQFLRVVCDEARGKMLVSMPARLDHPGQDIELMRYFERVGGHHVLLGCPLHYTSEGEEDIYLALKSACTETGLCIDLNPSSRAELPDAPAHLISVQTICRLADIDTVVGVSLGTHCPPNLAAHLFRNVGEQLLVNDPRDHAWAYGCASGQQWAGPLPYDIWQTAEDKRAVRMFQLFRAGFLDLAMPLYDAMEPLRRATRNLHGHLSASGIDGHLTVKYQQFIVGGNGGLLRQSVHRMHASEAAMLRDAARESGLALQEGCLEEFYVGRAAWRHGRRLS